VIQLLRPRIANSWGYNGNDYQERGLLNNDNQGSVLSRVLSGFFALFDDAVPVLIHGGPNLVGAD
jgi:hypothetical protein